MAELTQILQMADEVEQKLALNTYENEKRACEGDSLGTRCARCYRRGKPSCFNTKKAKTEGWKWS